MISPSANNMKEKVREGLLYKEAIRESRRILEEVITLIESLKKKYLHDGELDTLNNLVTIALACLKTPDESSKEKHSIHFDLHQVIKRVLSLLDYQTRVRDIKVYYRLPEKPQIVCGEEINLLRTLLFLMMNIIKLYEFSEEPREITIETDCTTDSCSIIIRDRLKSPDLDSHARQLMRELLENQGYDIEISHHEQGRVCRIQIPVVKNRNSSPTGLNILIVDDDPTICEYLRDLFTYLGHTPTVITSPKEALRLLKTVSFDLLLVDFVMPEMNGVHFLHEARKLCSPSKVCFFTGDIHAPEIMEIREKEGVQVLGKPLSINKLKEIIKQAGSAS
ncbi:MAG: response regulator [Nitrospirae bacterium]|nr:response regulator [Nitrospirota bacterium]